MLRPSRLAVALAASFAVAVLIGRWSAPTRVVVRATSPLEVEGPQSILIEAGSVEARLRAMETQLVELRVTIERLSAVMGGEE